MFLITSAAYITSGLASEFGKIPPTMLPAQNKRLYEHQLALICNDDFIVLSLPQSYCLSVYDSRRLSAFGVRVVFVPDELTLGQSVVYVLNVVGKYNDPLSILHGDTLFGKLTLKKNFCAVAKADVAYEWDTVNEKTKDVFAGFFSFSDQSLLIQKIIESGFCFINGIKEYGKECKLTFEELPEWMDFGLANSYYRSVSRMTTQRAFNSMKATRYSIIKSSKDKQKMAAEANWFMSLPSNMRHYAPTVWQIGENDSHAFYEIEYYYLSSLANLFVFGRNKVFVWEDILDACVEFLNDESRIKPDNLKEVAVSNNAFFGPKTLERLEEYSIQSGVSLDNPWIINDEAVPSLREITTITDSMITKNDVRFVTLMHGDPCFSNILYDFKSKSIKVIDPRGRDNNGRQSLYGDFRYDVSKLSHSVIGLYDLIIGGMYSYNEKKAYDVSLHFEVNDEMRHVQDYFKSLRFGGYSLDELSVYPIMIHLFLSMLPLHCDDTERQKALLANALRLYTEIKFQ